MNFDAWMKKVNQELINSYGMVADDLPDCPYYDWFHSKVKPTAAAKRAIKRAAEYI